MTATAREGVAPEPSEPPAVFGTGPSTDERTSRLAGGADQLARSDGRHPILGNERFLLAVAATLMTVGVTAIVFGWVGAANSTLVEEQLPYLISGGLLGLALSIIGAITVLSHWLTVMIRENRQTEAARRRDHLELIEALRVGRGEPPAKEATNGRARSSRSARPVRRTSGGS